MQCQTVWTLIRPEQNVETDLGPNCLQRLSADDMSGKVLMQKVKYNGFDPKLSEPGKTIWILVWLLWLFSQTPCIHLGIPKGGGSKLITFSYISIQLIQMLHALIQRGGGGARGPDSPGKTQVIWDSIGKK